LFGQRHTLADRRATPRAPAARVALQPACERTGRSTSASSASPIRPGS
jgi:hypothetical protein